MAIALADIADEIEDVLAPVYEMMDMRDGLPQDDVEEIRDAVTGAGGQDEFGIALQQEPPRLFQQLLRAVSQGHLYVGEDVSGDRIHRGHLFAALVDLVEPLHRDHDGFIDDPLAADIDVPQEPLELRIAGEAQLLGETDDGGVADPQRLRQLQRGEEAAGLEMVHDVIRNDLQLGGQGVLGQ